MKRTFAIIIFLSTVWTTYGQTWEDVGSGLNDKVYDLIKFDNKLYAGGRIGVKHWDGSTWTSLPNPSGIAHPLTLSVFNDTLYVGGDFPWSGSISHVYKYNGTSWVQAGGDFNEGSWSSTKRLLYFDNRLISGGRFTSINGVPINNIASWSGIVWDSLGAGLNGTVWNLAEHNGELYASGNFTASGNDTTIRRIAKWGGSNWSALDTTHYFNSTGPMISFDNSLIIGNVWDTIAGIQMKGIAKWNGSSFVSMGNNLLRSVSNFWTFDNDLYLNGATYNLNPNDWDNVVLKWNGFFWTQIGIDFDQPILTIDDFNGELFCGGFFTTPNSYIGKLNTTTGFSGIDKQPIFHFYPNPTSEHIVFTTDEKGTLIITNQIGQVVLTVSIRENQTQISTNTLQPGMYMVTFQTVKHQAINRLIIQ